MQGGCREFRICRPQGLRCTGPALAFGRAGSYAAKVLVLALETSSKYGSVALVRDGQVLGFEEYEELNAHAERLLPLIETVLRGAGCSRTDVTRIAVGTGPGNFTGLRVGISLAYGLGIGLGVPVVGVGSLACVANAARVGFDVILVLRDARKAEFFAAAFDGALQPLLEPHLVKQGNAGQWVQAAVRSHVKPGDRWTLVGEGLVAVDASELISAGAALLGNAEALRPDARPVGILGERSQAAEWPLPEYIRDVDAVLPTLRKNPAIDSELSR